MDILFCHNCADLRKVQPDCKDFQYCKCGKGYAIIEAGELRISDEATIFETDLDQLFRNVEISLENDLDNPTPPDTIMRIKEVSMIDKDFDYSECDD